MSVDGNSGSISGAALVIFAAALVILGTFLVLVVGVASTVVGWIPQPSLGTLIIVFQIYVAATVLSILIRGLRALSALPSGSAVVVVLGVVTLLGVPILYLLFHAVTAVWEALPDSYEAQVSFLFIIALLLGNLTRTGDN